MDKVKEFMAELQNIAAEDVHPVIDTACKYIKDLEAENKLMRNRHIEPGTIPDNSMRKAMAAQILSGLLQVSGAGYDGAGAWGLKVADSDLVEYSVELALKIEAQVEKNSYIKYDSQD